MHPESQSELELSLKALQTMQFGPQWGQASRKPDPKSERPRSSDTHKRTFASKPPRRPHKEPLAHTSEEWFLVEFYPEEAPFKALTKAIRQSHKTYELFDLARLVLEKPERFSVSLQKLTQGASSGRHTQDLQASDFSPFTLYQCVIDGLCFESQAEALGHLFKHHASSFFNIEEREGEAPKGSFPFIQCCGITQEPIAPPNYHRYQELLQTHYREHIKGLSFDQFVQRLKSDKSPEVQAAWLEKMKKVRHYQPIQSPDEQAEWLGSLEAAKDYVVNHIKDKAIKPLSSLKVPAASLAHCSKSLKAAVEQALFQQRSFPLELANHIRSRLRHYGFFIYKKGAKGVAYVCAVKPKRRDAHTQFSASIQALISFLDQHPLITLPEVLEQFLPVAPQQDLNTTATENPLVKSTMRDLDWLITEGYVIHYADGRLKALQPLDAKEDPDKTPEDNSQA